MEEYYYLPSYFNNNYAVVEKEGEFFIIERVSLVGYLVLLMGVFTFVLVLLIHLFGTNKILALVLTILLVPAIFWKLIRTKIRI